MHLYIFASTAHCSVYLHFTLHDIISAGVFV